MRMTKKFSWIVVAVLLLVVVSVAWADTQCWQVTRSRAVNDFGSGTGWCEGWWYASCTYCWDASGGGGTCSTNLIGTCNPPTEEHQN